MPEQIEQDENQVANSSAATGDNGQASPPEQQPEQQQPVVGDDVLEDVADDPDAGTEVTGDVGDQPNSQQQQQAAPVVPPVTDKDGDDKLPFNTHPRWKELIEEKNGYKTQIETLRTDAEQARSLNGILRQYNIRNDEFENAIKYLIALRTDPRQAAAMLKPTWEQLGMLTGDILPADLQAEVAAGTLTPERAKQIAEAQGQQRWQQWRGQNGAQAQASDMQSVVNQTTSMWEQTKIGLDPDFKPGSALYKQVALHLGVMKAGDAQQAHANCEKAYKQAKEDLAAFVPKPVPSRRPPQSRPQPVNNGAVMKDAKDVVNAIKAGIRPGQMRYAQ